MSRRCSFAGRMMLAVLSAAFAMHAAASQAEIELDPAKTKIEWSVSDVLHTVHGAFQMKRGRIVYDPDSQRISGEIVIGTASGESGNDARDRRMKKNVLETERFPEARFVPIRVDGPIAMRGSSSARVVGTLDIHGGSHELAMPVSVKISGEEIRAQGSFTIPYVAWGMKDPSTFVLRVDKTVKVQVSAVGHILPSRQEGPDK